MQELLEEQVGDATHIGTSRKKRKTAFIMERENLGLETCELDKTKDIMEDIERSEEMEDDTRALTLHEVAEALLGVSTSQSMAPMCGHSP